MRLSLWLAVTLVHQVLTRAEPDLQSCVASCQAAAVCPAMLDDDTRVSGGKVPAGRWVWIPDDEDSFSMMQSPNFAGLVQRRAPAALAKDSRLQAADTSEEVLTTAPLPTSDLPAASVIADRGFQAAETRELDLGQDSTPLEDEDVKSVWAWFVHHLQLFAGWSKRSVAWIAAWVFVALIGAVPLLSLYLDNKKITNVQLGQSIVMLVWLFGGIYMLTNIIKFHGSWEGERPLNIVETVYLMSQVITTVGYGDITPTTTRGMTTISIYVMVSVFVVFGMVSDVVAVVLARLAERADKAVDKVGHVGGQKASSSADEPGHLQEDDHLDSRKVVIRLRDWDSQLHVPWKSIVSSFLMFGVFMVAGLLFFGGYPAEKKTFGEAIYMAFITMSTVGFGAKTAITPLGKAFSAYWMVMGAAVLANCVVAVATLLQRVKEYERYDAEAEKRSFWKLIDSTPKDADGFIDELAYLHFSIRNLNLVPTDMLNRLNEQFRSLGPDKRGKVRLSRLLKLEGPPGEFDDTDVSRIRGAVAPRRVGSPPPPHGAPPVRDFRPVATQLYQH
eukprot:gnl/TRDRNA2_/TRDRNA2_165897_c0_seq1.p1 gnl/TRDRNA2_/TRDRNA2_165897_c0~~gnl/TRDRNA2_/TRDRNA2_165897_c0_seq1.p1  ORF type:complete len:558 (-),score=94.01 gnl/TRDRNA2_/TRDRNA2_165897_c0_seq1:79-1752(-)